ncbi:MAG TPA: hypothetical protein PLK30_11880 [Blastocatellia bacterium]|nr:hypothetical protein [Blastocatellia bacterium]
MQYKTIFILLMVFAFASLAIGQVKKADDRALPKQLSENEVQTILKQTEPKAHVEATLKVSDLRMTNALKNVQDGQFQAAVENTDVYASLIIYADDYTRKMPDSQSKDRLNCLKKIEQAIFKQSRNLDAVNRGIPFDYREPLVDKINQVKKIRLRALDDFLGGGKFIHSSSNEQ